MMQYKVSEKSGKSYIEGKKGEIIIGNVQNAVDLVGICIEYNTQLILLYSGNLYEDFYDLKTTLAGNVLQKFANYRLKFALVIPMEELKGRFREMATESNKGGHFRVFENKELAVDWLVMD